MQHPFHPFVRLVFRGPLPIPANRPASPPVDKAIVIRAAGISALAARIDAIGLGLIRQLYDHPPAGTVELFGRIDAIGAAAYRQMSPAQCRQPQQVTGPGIFEFGPGELAFLPGL
jgi:hypothetical protein